MAGKEEENYMNHCGCQEIFSNALVKLRDRDRDNENERGHRVRAKLS